MSKAGDFRREVNRLVAKRTRWLLRVLENPNEPPTERLSRNQVNRAVEHLQHIASDALTDRLAGREFQASTESRIRWTVNAGKGRGPDQKKAAFKKWYKEEVRKSTCIYVFRAGERAIYVGKTTKGGGRPASHFSQHWFSAVKSVDVYPVRGSRPLPALECLAIHSFQPSRNKVAAETRKWTNKCPLCQIHQEIDDQLRDIVR
ncbi:MAG: hypothetical protein AABX89_02865 [Candidatus Thermoplasmatota archaeon]